MSKLYSKTAQYSIAAAATLMLFTGAPAFAAKKSIGKKPRTILQSIEAAIGVGQSATAQAAGTTTATTTADTAASTATTSSDTTTASTTATTSTPDPLPPPQPVETPVLTPTPAPTSTESTVDSATSTPPAPAATTPTSPFAETLSAIEAAMASAKTHIFPKQFPKQAATSTASTTGAIATTGIASLFQGSAMAGNVYATNKFDQSETYKLLALSLALAAAGLFLTNTKVFSRTYKDLADVIIVGAEPRQTSRSRA